MSTSAVPLFNAVQFNAALFGGGVPPGTITIQVSHGILYPALRKAGVTLGPGRTPSPAQFQDAIDELNRLAGSLNCDRLFIYSITRSEYPLDPPKASYTIGQSPDPFEPVDFRAQRPQLIERANIITSQQSIRYPLVLAGDLQWADIPLQEMPNTIPQILYNDRAFPVSTLYLWGQPMSGQVLELFTWTQVPYFLTITDVVLLPLQYFDALVLNLAVRLAPHFQKVLDQNVREDARISLMRLESINAPQPIADLSGGLGCGCNRYNVYSDETG
jgi:hypothetical protein